MSDSVHETFPELRHVEDDTLREGVREAWTTAMADNDVEDLTTVPWSPPLQRQIGAEDVYLVPHVRDVTACAVALTETLVERRDPDVSLDTVIAGALLHDVSKLYEYDDMATTAVGDLLGHPYYGVHVVGDADLPTEVAHVVLSHSPRTNLEPATLEAAVVRLADETAAAAIRAAAVEDLREA